MVQMQEEHERECANLESRLRSLQDDLRVVTAKFHQSQVRANASPCELSAWQQHASMHMPVSFCYALHNQDRQALHDELHWKSKMGDAQATCVILATLQLLL